MTQHPMLAEVTSRQVAGEVIEFGELPFGDGEPMFPSDRVPAFPSVNPMWRRRLQRLRDAFVISQVEQERAA